MSDFMRWMYDNYIRPNIESQPKDSLTEMQLDLMNNELDEKLKKVLQSILAFYAVQGFRLGVRTGVTLSEDLG